MTLSYLTFFLLAFHWDTPCDEVSGSPAFLCHDLPHLVMAVGPLKRGL